MTRRKEVLLITAASIVGLLVVIVIGAVAVLRTQWFADFARAKILAAANDATGGTAEMQAFELDLRQLTVKIHNFVLHGKEARNADPLCRVKLLGSTVEVADSLGEAVRHSLFGGGRAASQRDRVAGRHDKHSRAKNS